MSAIDEFKQFSDHQPGLDFLYEKVLEKAKSLPENAPFVEIGTRRGGSALIFLTAIKNSGIQRPLYTIDPYGNKPYKLSDATIFRVAIDDYYKDAMKLLSIYCSMHNLFWTHFRITSFDFMKIYEQINIWWDERALKELFGFVYLDGEHNEDTVAKELEWFQPRMHKDGLIVIDDDENVKVSNFEVIKEFFSRSYQDLNRSYVDYSFEINKKTVGNHPHG